MARALCSFELQDSTGIAQGSKALTFYEVNGTTPLAQTIYDSPSGGSVITTPTTNSLGLFEGYVATPQRVKISSTAFTGQKNASFDPDPSTVLIQNPGVMVNLDAGLTVVRNSAGVATATALTLRDSNAAGYGIRLRNSGDTLDLWRADGTAVASVVPMTGIVNSASYALSLKNAEANARVLEVKNAAGTVVGRWGALGLELPQNNEDMGRLAIGEGFITEKSSIKLRHVAAAGSGGWKMIDHVLDLNNTGNDDSGGSFAVRQLAAGGGNTALRVFDLNMLRSSGDGIPQTTGLEVGFHSTIAPSTSDDHHIGIWLLQAVGTWINAAGPFVAQAIGFKISGTSGWNDAIRFYDKGGFSVFRVAGGERAGDRHGDVIAGGDIYSEPVSGLAGSGNGGTRVGVLDHTLATGTTTRAGMNYSDAQNALVIGARTLGTGYRPILLAPNGGNVGVGYTTSAAVTAALSVNGTALVAGISTLTGVALAAAESIGGAAVITPTQIAANTDNYNPTGLATARIMLMSTDAARNLTGIVAPAVGQVLTIINVGSFNLVIKNSTTSTAANQFSLSGDITLAPGNAATFFYQLSGARWRAMDSRTAAP